MSAIKLKVMPKPAAAKKKRKAPVHRVEASLQVVSMTKRGSSLTLDAFANDKKLGTLEIGAGSLKWFPTRSKGKTFKQVSWTRFAEMFAPDEK